MARITQRERFARDQHKETRLVDSDETVAALVELFAEHHAWQQAASRIDPSSISNIYFTHRPGEVWQLSRRETGSLLEVGKTDDPDFVLRFSPAAVRRLCRVRGGVAEFAAEFFSLVDQQKIDLRVVAPFSRLRDRGYLRLLLEAGPKIAVFGLSRGIFGIGSLARFLRRAGSTPPHEWEA